MEITSITFFEFVALSLLIYWIVPKKYQWIILFVSSVLFYITATLWYTLIYVIVSVISVFLATKYFQESKDKKKNKAVLILCLIVNFGLLAVLKYTNLAIHTFNFLSNNLFHVKTFCDVDWLPSLAISFYTMQMTAFLLDCYWGTAEPFKNPLHLGLYCFYYPLMTSGPICRYNQIGIGLFEENRFNYERVKLGLYRIGWGLVKKMVVSNRLAVIVDQLWLQKNITYGINIWIVSALFAIQLYTDFSGCIDILSGISECYGIILPNNFNAPFCSKSVQEFWQRWHISLGAWSKDYILNPLLKSKPFIKLGKSAKKIFGKKQGKKIPVYIAMFILWFYMGVWHGNSWKYIIGEGIWFWLIIVLSQIMSPVFVKINKALKINDDFLLWRFLRSFRTFAIYCVGALFFRATSLQDAFYRIKVGIHLSKISESIYDFVCAISFDNIGGSVGCIIMVISLSVIFIVDYLKYNNIDIKKIISESKWYIRWPLYYIMIFAIYMSLSITNQESLYAQL